MVLPEQIPARMKRQKKTTSSNTYSLKDSLNNLVVLLIAMLKLIPSTVLLMAVGWLAWGSMQTAPYFFKQQLQQLSVEGLHLLTEDDILDSAQLPSTKNLSTLDPYELAEQATMNKIVKTSHVRRYFPDQLHFFIKEFGPRATIEHKGKLFLIDENRNLLMKVNSDGIVSAPVLRGFDRQKISDLSDSFRLGQALRFQNSLRMNKTFKQKVQYIDVEEPLNVKVKLFQEPTVIFFGSNFFAERVEIFEKIYGPIQEKHKLPQRIDLRYHNKLIVTP
jgi:cell division septal protein FtsQ